MCCAVQYRGNRGARGQFSKCLMLSGVSPLGPSWRGDCTQPGALVQTGLWGVCVMTCFCAGGSSLPSESQGEAARALLFWDEMPF